MSSPKLSGARNCGSRINLWAVAFFVTIIVVGLLLLVTRSGDAPSAAAVNPFTGQPWAEGELDAYRDQLRRWQDRNQAQSGG